MQKLAHGLDVAWGKMWSYRLQVESGAAGSSQCTEYGNWFGAGKVLGGFSLTVTRLKKVVSDIPPSSWRAQGNEASQCLLSFSATAVLHSGDLLPGLCSAGA